MLCQMKQKRRKSLHLVRPFMYNSTKWHCAKPSLLCYLLSWSDFQVRRHQNWRHWSRKKSKNRWHSFLPSWMRRWKLLRVIKARNQTLSSPKEVKRPRRNKLTQTLTEICLIINKNNNFSTQQYTECFLSKCANVVHFSDRKFEEKWHWGMRWVGNTAPVREMVTNGFHCTWVGFLLRNVCMLDGFPPQLLTVLYLNVTLVYTLDHSLVSTLYTSV